MSMVGGVGNTKPADDTVQEILAAVLEELKTKVAEKRNSPAPPQLQPVSYKTQLVAGTNYFIKVKLDQDDYVHVRVYRNLQGVTTLHSITEQKTENDEIEHF